MTEFGEPHGKGRFLWLVVVTVAIISFSVLISGCVEPKTREDYVAGGKDNLSNTIVDEHGVVCYYNIYDSRALSCVKVK